MNASRNLALLALALVASGAAIFTSISASYDTAHAATADLLPHDTYASGIPYYPGAAINSKNYTQFGGPDLYQNKHDTAIDRWNAMLPRPYLLKWDSTREIRQYMVATGSTEDIQLEKWLKEVGGEAEAASCKLQLPDAAHRAPNNQRSTPPLHSQPPDISPT